MSRLISLISQATKRTSFRPAVLSHLQSNGYRASGAVLASAQTTNTQVDSEQQGLARSSPKKTTTTFDKPFSKRKAALFDKYEKILVTTPALLIVQYINMPSDEWTQLRMQLKLECHGARATALSTGIMTSVVRDTKYANLKALFAGSVFTISWDDLSKTGNYVDPQGNNLGEFKLKDHLSKSLGLINKSQKLILLGGFVEDSLMTPDMIKEYTKIPEIDNLQAQIVGILQQPSSALVGTLQNIPSRLVSVLKQKAEESNPQ